MALDGALLRHLKKEFDETVINGRVDKIYQPNKDELVVSIRTKEGSYKLLFSARANNPRVNLFDGNIENPAQPPMLCMLLRKKLQGARLVEVFQPGLERVLHFKFDAANELGDRVNLTLAVEIMGKYSNVILFDENGVIVDALKRVDSEMSSQRLVLPGREYNLPPPQDKLNPLDTTSAELVDAIKRQSKNMLLSKALVLSLQGISPVVARELEYQVGRGRDIETKTMTEEDEFRLGFFFQKFKEILVEFEGKPYIIVDKNGKPIDFSFLNIQQYGTTAVVKELGSFSEILESFYKERDKMERMKVREQDLLRHLSNLSERTSRKIVNQKAELERSIDREDLRVKADLISANQHTIQKGSKVAELQNFYDENLGTVKISLDPALSASQNAQRFYKLYRKAKTAEVKLVEQIELAEKELEYIDSVFEALSLAETEKDLAEIKAELADEGYIRVIKSKRDKLPKVSEPLRFVVSDGFTVLVGRNNRQNDKLTLKMARKQDVWFHTKNIPGSHTVLITDNREPTESSLLDAANLAAKYSRGKDSPHVSIDYTKVKNVSKPKGAKPGMVIYVDFKTIDANPFEAVSEENEA